MKTIKTSILFLFLLAISHTQAQKHFRVLDATSMTYNGGLPQSGSGTVYTLKVLLLTTDKVNFTEGWAGSDYGELKTLPLVFKPNFVPTKGDTVLVKLDIHHYPPNNAPNMPERPKEVKKSAPISYEGAMLVAFRIGKKTRYRAIPAVRKVAMANYE